MRWLALIALAALACSSGSSIATPEPVLGGTFKECPPAPTVDREFEHRRTSLTRATGSPRHGSADVIAVGGQIEIRSRFVYGKIQKDLEDEVIELWLEDGTCNWKKVGEQKTNDDGVARFTIAAPNPGVYNFEVVVAGDGSRARAEIYSIKPDQRIVVFDIDGTLTTGDDEIADQLLTGEIPEQEPGGREVATAYAKAGVMPVYITGRPMILYGISRDWLREKSFPKGPLDLTQGFRAGIRRVGEFKTEALKRLTGELGLDIVAAYGNASTDICAYADAGIPPSRTFIIGKNAGKACRGGEPTQALSDYPSHEPLVGNAAPTP